MTTTTKPRIPHGYEASNSNNALFFGTALMVLGIVIVLAAIFYSFASVYVIGSMMIGASIAELTLAVNFHKGRNVLLNVFSGTTYLIVGALFVLNPSAGALILTKMVSAFLIAAGSLRCLMSFMRMKKRDWGWFMFSGMLNLMLGDLLMLGWPATEFWVVGTILGLEMIFHGVAWTSMSSNLLEVKVKRAFS